jgi:hypothetical protein
MHRSSAVTTLLLLAISLLPAQNQAAPRPAAGANRSASALLRAEGKSIKVNGVVVPATMTIFSNDRIQTGADTVAYIMVPGRMFTLDRKSSAVFRDGTLVVNRGRGWLSEKAGTASQTQLFPLLPAGAARGSGVVSAATTASPDDNHDRFTGICAQFSAGCDQAEDACESKFHRECVCHYVSDRDQDDVSPIHPDADDFKCQPIKCSGGDDCE